MNEVKKVLIIGYLYRELQGGSFRVPGLAKYLPEFGWQPLVLTAPPDQKPDPQLRVIETAYRDTLGWVRGLLRVRPGDSIVRQVDHRLGFATKRSFVGSWLIFMGGIVNYPDREKGWKPYALKAGGEILEQENIQAIISNSNPIISHLIAKELKANRRIPWIADLCDLWTQNHAYPHGRLRRRLDKRLELKTLCQADALVTVSKPWAEKLRAMHNGKPVYTITHGFDPDIVNMPPARLTAKFTITYTGGIFPYYHDPVKILVALSALITSDKSVNRDDLELRFYGLREEWLDKEIEKYGLTGIVRQYGTVPKQVAQEKQRESQLLLLLKWEDPQEQGVHSGKVFEYLAARRPILAIGGSKDVVTELLAETKAGIDALSVENITETLKELYAEFKTKGKVTYTGLESKVNQYSRREMAGKFANILNSLT